MKNRKSLRDDGCSSLGSRGSCNSFAKDDDHDGRCDVQQLRFRSYGCNRFSRKSKLSHALTTTTTTPAMALVMAVCLLLPLACHANSSPDALSNPSGGRDENNDIITNLDDDSEISETPSFLSASLGGGLEENIRSEVKNEIKTVQTASPAILNALDVLPENEKLLLIENPKVSSTTGTVESKDEPLIDIAAPEETQCDALVCKWNKTRLPSTTSATPAQDLPTVSTPLPIVLESTPEPSLPAVTEQSTALPLPEVTESTPTPESINANASKEQQQPIGESMREPRTLEKVNPERNLEENKEILTQVADKIEVFNVPTVTNTTNPEQETGSDISLNTTQSEPSAPSNEVELDFPNNISALVPSSNVIAEAEQQTTKEQSTAEIPLSVPTNEESVAAVAPNETITQILNEEVSPAQPLDSTNSTAVNENDEALEASNISNESSIVPTEPLLPPRLSSDSNELNTETEIPNNKIDTEDQISATKLSNSLQEPLAPVKILETDLESNESLESDVVNLPIPSNSNDISQSEESNEDLQATTTPSSVELAQNSNLVTENDTLSIVFEEPLSATEPTVLLENESLKNHIDSEETDISEVETPQTTQPPEEALHNVIKKQGVEIETDTNFETTTILPPPVFFIDEPIEEAIVVPEANDVNASPIEISSSTPQPVIPNTQADIVEHLTLSTIATLAANDITEVSVVFPGKGDEDATTTSKGSRSINSLQGSFNGNQKASMNFDIYPAGQTLNGNLAEELPNGIGKALPTHRFNEEPSNRSTLIIALCSGTVVLFIVVSVGIFLISFQRQHGTLDIEMQEQRCGKDNINDDIPESRVKLLDVDLPNSSSVNQTDAEAEIEECL